jgi:hypothetical protein
MPLLEFGPAKPWSYSVRDKKDGRLLLASGWGVATTLFAPLTFDHQSTTCSGAYDDGCGSGSATYSSFDVHGDSTVTIDDGQSATVRAGGVDYAVELMSKNIEISAFSDRCADYSGPYTGFGVNAAIEDTTPLVGTFDVGAPIACALENADLKQVNFSFYDVDFNTAYDGKVVYAKRGQPGGNDCFDFTTTLTGADGTPALMEFCVSPGLFTEPTVGQAFWATTTGWQLGALKSSNGGQVLLAAVNQSVPFDTTAKADLAAVLGVPVDARQRCPYAAGYALWETTFGTTSQVILGPSGHATPTIGGKSYDAWMAQNDTSLGISIVAR